MALRHTLLQAAAAILAGALALPAPSRAQDSIYVPLFTYRTGAFAGSGVPIADGMHDYLEMLNQRASSQSTDRCRERSGKIVPGEDVRASLIRYGLRQRRLLDR